MMKSRIRLLARWLSLILMISFGVNANTSFIVNASYDSSSEQYNKEALILNALGIMQYSENNNNPDTLVTRGEFVKRIIRIMGINQTAIPVTADSRFTDIQQKDILFYAQTARDLGLMSGTSETEFSPETQIIYEQAVTVVVRALGYEVYAQANGGYPIGYIATANEKKILKDVNGTIGEPITEKQLTMMFYNALTVPKFINLDFSSQQDKYVVSGTSGTKEVTLLKDSLRFEKYRVEITDLGDLRKEENSSDKVISVRIDDYKIPFGYQYQNGETVRLALKDTVRVEGLKNTTQTIFVKEDMIYWISEETKNKFFCDFIYEIDGEIDTAPVPLQDIIDHGTDITFLNSGEKYSITENTKIYYYPLEGTSLAPMQPTDSSLPSHIGKFTKVVAEDGDLLALYIYEMVDDMIITAIGKSSITYDWKERKGLKLEDLDEAKEITILLDGESVLYEELKTNMLLSYWKYENEYLFVASSKFIVANFNEFNYEKAKVGEKEYYTAFNCFYSINYGNTYKYADSGINDLLGQEVYAYFNARGEIAYIKTGIDSNVFYGVVRGISKKAFTENIGIFRSIGSGNYVEGVNITYPLHLKNSQVSAETAAANADNRQGKGIYKFTINKKGELVQIEQPDWMPYFDQVDFPQLSEYLFPAGTKSMVTKLYSSGGVTSFDQSNNRIKVRPKVFTVDASADASGALIGPRVGLKGNYKRQAGSPASDKLYVDQYANAIQDSDIFITPEALVPNTTNSGGSEVDVFLNNDSRIFSLLDNDGNFNPSLVKLKDISGKTTAGVNMLIENSLPYTSLAVIVSGKETIESTYNMKIGYVEKLSKITNMDNEEDFYRATVYTEDYLKKEYTIDLKNASGIKKNTFIAFRESGIVLDVGSVADDIPADVQGNGSIRVYYTYNPKDIKNDGSNQTFVSAANNSCSAFTSQMINTNNYTKTIKFTVIEGLDDRIIQGVDFIDNKVVQITVDGVRSVFGMGAMVLVYRYDPASGEIEKAYFSEITTQSSKVWLLKRDGFVRAILYIK